jgi:hypothetical protein
VLNIVVQNWGPIFTIDISVEGARHGRASPCHCSRRDQARDRAFSLTDRLRDLKTSMGMEVLRCKSPQMVHKELEMFFIAYNLIRCLMVQSGAVHHVALERMSFKGTVDSVRQFSLAIAQARSKRKQNQLLVEFLEVIARDQVPDRPNRLEPRAVKRRPKPFQRLNRPRRLMKEITHRSRYRKTA